MIHAPFLPVTASGLAEFQAQGFLVIRSLFDPEDLSALRHEIRRLQRDGRLIDLLGPGAGEGDRKGGGAGEVHAEAPRASNLQLCPLSPHSELVRMLRWHPRALAVVRALVGDPLLFLLDQVFIKPPRCGAGTAWHQDHAYFAGGDPRHGVGMWIPLQDVGAANGTMQVVPGSHHAPVAHARDPRSQVLIRAEVGQREVRTMELEAGDCLCFGFGLLHATQDNPGSEARAAIALHFCHQDYAPPASWNLVEPLSGAAARPPDGSWQAACDAVLLQPTREPPLH